MNREILEKINFWKQHANQENIDLINKMSDEELEEAFTHQMEFGTAGIRGKIGPGTNRMNIYNIAKPTYGYAKFLKEKYGNKDIKVVIGTDNRHKREEFSQVAADILTSFGIKVFKTLIVPTPFVSFAIRHLQADGGIIITASHNPADNNGYKVYDNTGSQLLPEDADKIAKYSEEREEYLTYSYEADKDLVWEIPEETFESYGIAVKKIAKDNKPKKLKIVFSPQHGTSAQFIPKYLRDLGYEVIEVTEQMSHDPNFSFTPSPNPELLAAYDLGIEYAKKHNADIFITTDPDADRIGVAALKNGKFEVLNGNQTAPILFDHILKNTPNKSNTFIAYSYVSTNLCEMMAEKNGVQSFQVATGFKWIGDIIEKFISKKYIFGFEESFGSLIDSAIARDKDSIQAAIMITEIAELAKRNDKSLWDILEDIYKKYSYFREDTKTKSFEGVKAIEDRIAFMDNLRRKADHMFDDEYEIIDLSHGYEYVAPMNLVKFAFKSGSWIAARPSGTEPKIKFYKVAVAPTIEAVEIENKKLNKYLDLIMEGK